MDNNSINFSSDGFNNFGNSSKNFNTSTSHPLIQSSQEYMYYNKYISIHSEDRNILKYPNSSEFEFEVPEDLLNVSALRLINWCFPEKYNTFSSLNNNVTMSFSINNPYSPNVQNPPVENLLAQKTFEYLFLTQTQIYQIVIEDGFYTPQQMVTELTNKFNAAVTSNLIDYFTEKGMTDTTYITALNELNEAGGYTNFVIVYNSVSQKIWFGNICDGFILQNELQLANNTSGDISHCATKGQLPNFSDWGLPCNLGLNRCNTMSNYQVSSTNIVTYNGNIVPRFFYGDVLPGDNGYWLLPNPTLTGSQVQWVECFTKVNLLGPCYIYMELHGQNCIDETSPFNVSNYTLKNSSNNGIVNSAFAKIPIRNNCCSQYIERDSLPYKFYYPPAERMRKFYIKFRYHNGQLVNFGELDFSFVIEFTLQMPQMLRTSKSIVYPPNINCSR